MTAYLAIIKDAFREAIASKMLWVLLILSALMLALLSPFNVTESAGARFAETDLLDDQGLFRRVYATRESTEKTPERRIWESLSEDRRDRMQRAAEQEGDGIITASQRYEQIILALNEVVDDPEFYDAAYFQNVSYTDEAESLVSQGEDISPELAARRNRLVLESALPADFAAAAPRQTTVWYFGYEIIGPLVGESNEKQTFVVSWLTFIADYGVGVLGVFCAILVTANMIPQTFEQGAIDLLLSKPVSRPLVFLAKFAGGCVFIFLVATFCIAGIFLLAGLRIGVWHPQFLLCIPVVTFIFAIYYSVSALAGAIWRNAIVSVVVTIAFWALCYLTWAFHFFGTAALEPDTMVHVSQTDAGVIGVRQSREYALWDGEEWDDLIEPTDENLNSPLINLPQAVPRPPVYDPRTERFYTVMMPGFLSSEEAKLLIAEKNEDGDWEQREGVNAPRGVLQTFLRDNGVANELFFLTSTGVFKANSPEIQSDGTGPSLMWEGLKYGLSALSGSPVTSPPPAGFDAVGPTLNLLQPCSGEYDRGTGRIVLANAREIVVLRSVENADDGVMWELEARMEMDDSHQRVAAIAGETVVAAQSDGTIRVFNASDLTPRAEFTLSGKDAPRFVAAAPSGKWFAVVTHQKKLWMYDAEQDKRASADPYGQGEVTAASFNDNGELLVVTALDRVTAYDPTTFDDKESYSPSVSGGRAFMWYGVVPIYTACPKPGELGDLMKYFVHESSSRGATADLASQREALNVWDPVWSNLIFIAVVLGLGALYIARKDF